MVQPNDRDLALRAYNALVGVHHDKPPFNDWTEVVTIEDYGDKYKFLAFGMQRPITIDDMLSVRATIGDARVTRVEYDMDARTARDGSEYAGALCVHVTKRTAAVRRVTRAARDPCELPLRASKRTRTESVDDARSDAAPNDVPGVARTADAPGGTLPLAPVALEDSMGPADPTDPADPADPVDPMDSPSASPNGSSAPRRTWLGEVVSSFFGQTAPRGVPSR